MSARLPEKPKPQGRQRSLLRYSLRSFIFRPPLSISDSYRRYDERKVGFRFQGELNRLLALRGIELELGTILSIAYGSQVFSTEIEKRTLHSHALWNSIAASGANSLVRNPKPRERFPSRQANEPLGFSDTSLTLTNIHSRILRIFLLHEHFLVAQSQLTSKNSLLPRKQLR